MTASSSCAASLQAQQGVPKIDGRFTGDTELRLDGVESAVAPADDASLVEHGNLLGHGRVRVTKAAGKFVNREGLCKELSENDPAGGGTEGGEDTVQRGAVERYLGSGGRMIWRHGMENSAARWHFSRLLASQENFLHLQENDLKSQECVLHTRESVLHRQENVLHPQENVLHPPEFVLHAKEHVLHTQESVLQTQENSLQTQQRSLAHLKMRCAAAAAVKPPTCTA